MEQNTRNIKICMEAVIDNYEGFFIKNYVLDSFT